MKVYILCDMEGVSGIRRMEEVKSEHAVAYAYGCERMMEDINCAVDGALAGGPPKWSPATRTAAGGNCAWTRWTRGPFTRSPAAAG